MLENRPATNSDKGRSSTDAPIALTVKEEWSDLKFASLPLNLLRAHRLIPTRSKFGPRSWLRCESQCVTRVGSCAGGFRSDSSIHGTPADDVQ